MFSILLLTLFAINTHSTKEITGDILNSVTKDHIAYVSIGIEGRTVGTVSNKDGFFALKLSDNVSTLDSITFSHIGYQTKRVSSKEFTQAKCNIKLTPSSHKMEEVVVQGGKIKQQEIGRNHSGLGIVHYNFYTTKNIKLSDRLSSEVGVLLKIKNSCAVNSINFRISQNQFENIKFRLSFYSLDSDGLPKDIIVHKDIIMEIKDKHTDWYKYDLKSHDIFLDGDNDVVVSLTLLEDKMDSERNWFSLYAAKLPGHKIFTRQKAMDKWESNAFGVSLYLDVTSYLK